MSFGIGIVCWLMLGSFILNRLFFLERLEGALVPTLAIELAPPALAGGAYFALHGSAPGTVAYGFAGYAVLMVLVQVRLLPSYARLRFSPGFWSFTFPWCAVAGLALRWLGIERPPGQAVYAALAAGGVSLLVAGVAARSVLAIWRGDFAPGAGATPRVPATRASLTPHVSRSLAQQ
jgi:tellurite resistance protein